MRGKRPTTAVEEARKCAEQMGYRWVVNTDPELPFDAIMFRPAAIAAVKVKKIRHAVDDNVFIEKLFPEEVKALQSLPMPVHVLRELWVRMQNERAWRRFSILQDTTAEIGFNTAEGYTNPHFREDEWRESFLHRTVHYPLKDSSAEK